MSINATLLNQISDHLLSYDCWPDEIETFLTTREPFIERQQKAIQIVKGVMTTHGKQELFKHVAELARIEHGIRVLEPWVRDHVVHAVISFLLGIYINENWLKPIVGVYPNKLQWKLAGLFHDIGYPAQISQDILVQFSKTINTIKRKLESNRPDVYFRIEPVGIDRLTNGVNSLDLMQNCINGWGLQIDIKDEYMRMIKSGTTCHGIISSLATIYVIDLMYQKYNPERIYKDICAMGDNINWSQFYFENDIVPACSAIYIHNLPTRCFTGKKIDPCKAPLAFLLKVSDSLQQWERPSHDNQTGFSTDDFDIKIEDRNLILQANIPSREKEDIQEEIFSCIVDSYIKIL